MLIGEMYVTNCKILTFYQRYRIFKVSHYFIFFAHNTKARFNLIIAVYMKLKKKKNCKKTTPIETGLSTLDILIVINFQTFSLEFFSPEEN